MPELTIAERLMLVAFDTRTGRPAGGPEIYLAAAGAVVMDLVHAGLLDVRGGKLVTATKAPQPVRLLAEAAEAIASESQPKDVKHWVRFLAAPRFRLGQKLLTSLASAGILRPVTVLWLGVFKRQRYELADKGVRDGVIAGVRGALLSPATPDPATMTMIALLSSCGLVDRTVSREERGPARERAAAMARGDLGGEAVSNLIAEVQAEVMTAVIVTSIATSAVDTGGSGGHGH